MLLTLGLITGVACSKGFNSASQSQNLVLENTGSEIVMMSLRSVAGFTNNSFDFTSFTLNFTAVPNQNNQDLVIGLSKDAAGSYRELAAIIRFNPAGTIDVRNAAAYTAMGDVPYTAGTAYRFRMVVDVASHTYSVFVTPQGRSEIQLARDYAFRSDQATVTSLGHLAMYGNPGTASMTSISISLNLPNMGTSPAPAPASTPTPMPSSTPSPSTGVPLSFNDARFNNVTASGRVIIATGGSLVDRSIEEYSGDPSIVCNGGCTLTRVRVKSRESLRIVKDNIRIEDSYLEAIGSGDDHADVIQAYAPGNRGTLTLRNSSIVAHNTAATAGIFIADNWKPDLVDLENVMFSGGGVPYGLRLHADGYTGAHLRMKNVCFVGPFLYGKFIIDGFIIDEWTNVNECVIQSGQLVVTKAIPKP